MRRWRRMLGRMPAPSPSPAPTDAHDRRPADPDFPRRWSRRRRAAARPHHLHRAAARRRDHPRRPRHRRDPDRRAVAELDQLLLVPPARPLGVARRLAGVAGGPHDAVRAGGLARGHRRHGGRARLRQGAGIADPPQPQRQAEPVAVPARPGLAVPGRGGRAWVAGRGGAADAAPGPARHPPWQAQERPLPAAPARAAARPGAGPARRLVHARPADRGRARRRPHRDRSRAPRPRALRRPRPPRRRRRGRPRKYGSPLTPEKVEALPVHRSARVLYGRFEVVRYRSGRVAARFLKGRVVRAVWVRLERPDRPGEERLLLCTDPDLPAPEVITSYAKRWAVEPLFAAMKHGWGLKDAWQQSRQVLMRWVTILAAGYALGQMLAYTDPARVPGLASPAPWRPPGTRTAGLIRAGLARLLRGVGPAALTPAIARKSDRRTGHHIGRRTPAGAEAA